MPSSSYQLLPLSSAAADKATSAAGHVRIFSSLITRTRRRFILVMLIFAIGFTILLSIGMSSGDHWRGGTSAYDFVLPEGTWTCTDDGLSEAAKSTQYNKRSRQCVVENLCVDRKGTQIRIMVFSVLFPSLFLLLLFQDGYLNPLVPLHPFNRSVYSEQRLPPTKYARSQYHVVR